MSKPRRKPRKPPQPPLPPLGHYVLAYQAPDGTMCDPPIPLDQRLTDAELRQLVEAVQTKVKQKTVNHADELPGGIKQETSSPDLSNLPADQMTARSGSVHGPATTGIEPEDIMAALVRSPAYKGPPMSPEEADRVLAANGIPPAPTAADAKSPSHAPAPEPEVSSITAGGTPPPEDGWGYAAGSLIYRGLCLFTAAMLVGAGVILGSWAALKTLPWLEAVLSGAPADYL
jgi:hypothetical protein